MLWLDGQIHAGTQATFDLADRGLLLADGLFETILVLGGKPLLLDEHRDRLLAGCRILGLVCDGDVVTNAVRDLAGCSDGHSVVRVTVTRGAGQRGLRLPPAGRPSVFATLAPWTPALAFQPQTLATSTIRRNASSPLSRLKSLAYLDNVLALEEALRGGADDALLLSTNDTVACTSAANIFIILGNHLLTPPPVDGVLEGTVRRRLLQLAPKVGLAVAERSFGLEEIRQAAAVFMTNSVRLMAPATALDGTVLRTLTSPYFTALVAALQTHIVDICGVKVTAG